MSLPNDYIECEKCANDYREKHMYWFCADEPRPEGFPDGPYCEVCFDELEEEQNEQEKIQN